MNCPKCNSEAIKYGSKQGIQRYQCISCNYHFTQGTRPRLSEEQLNMVFEDLLSGMDRQEVANKYGVSLRTIQRWISNMQNE
ncbi:transposase [Enterococcus plantarum]|uniref:transposase n=1 Tax=Enterococcus plantarum TaxID=1077675 RepID=UPI003BF54428